MATAPPPSDDRPLVLVTGAAGWIGRNFATFAADRYRLRLMVQPNGTDTKDLSSFGEVLEADLADLPRLTEITRGAAAVVHLAGNPNPGATWDSILKNNIVGTYNVYVAAKAAGCPRVIYASSIHAVSGYPADVQVKANEPVNPGDLYGVSKCFGEAMGKYMAEQEGVGGVAIRIAAYQEPAKIEGDFGLKLADAWVSVRDLNELIALSIDRVEVKFAIVHGVSDNRFKRLDITNARELLGYSPRDNSTKTNAALKKLHLAELAMEHSLSDSQNPDAKSGLRDDLRLSSEKE